MNKIIFKKQIKNFLEEIDIRRAEIEAGKFISTNLIGKKLMEFARTSFDDNFKLVYSVGSIRLDIIFHLGEKSKLHNASNFTDIIRLSNALSYEIIANKYLYKDITLDDFYYVYWGYLIRLAKNFNFSETYNSNNTIYYMEWQKNDDTNIFSDNSIAILYNKIFVNNDYRVRDINGDFKEINIKNTEYNTMKRLTKEELVNLILKLGDKPSVKQIVTEYNNNLDLIDTDTIEDEDEYYKALKENKSKIISPELMRKYIKEYELESMIKTCNHSEKFLNKLK